jgi:superfamily II DNA or RNA helicase
MGNNLLSKFVPYELKREQEYAVSEIWKRFENNINPICALPIGGGKTIIACTIIKKMIQEGARRFLILAKYSNLKDPWENELNMFGIKYVRFHGKERIGRRVDGRYFLGQNNVMLTTHDTAALDIEYLLGVENFDLVIIDEIHAFNNAKKLTNKTIQLSRIVSFRKLYLTATPIQNTPLELGLLYVLLNKPEMIVNELQDARSMNSILKNEYDEAINKTIIIQHTSNENTVNIENRIINKNRIVLSIPIYQEMQNYLLENPESIFGKETNPFSKKCQQFLSHPNAIFKNNSIITKQINCGKVDAVLTIIERLPQREKIIIFSQYKDVLFRYSQQLKSIGKESIIVTGQDRGNSVNEKISRFKTTNIFNILLTTLFKSAEGINLPEANHVIILEFWWNPQRIIQAMGRIDRHNQKKDIFVYLLCYNQNGNMYMTEGYFLKHMIKKINHSKKVMPAQLELPEIKPFLNEYNFKEELKLFLNDFIKAPTNKKYKEEESSLRPVKKCEKDNLTEVEDFKNKAKQEQAKVDILEALMNALYQNSDNKKYDGIDLSSKH